MDHTYLKVLCFPVVFKKDSEVITKKMLKRGTREKPK